MTGSGRLFALFLTLCALTAAALPARAETVATDYAEASLIADVSQFRPGEPFTAALRLVPQEGWHTYWRNPGDAGLPTTLDWSLPEAVTAGGIGWPVPDRKMVGPLMNYGYAGPAVLTTEITPPADWKAGRPLDLLVEANWLICEEICVPEAATLAIRIPSGDTAITSVEAGEIQAALAAQPSEAVIPGRFELADGRLRIEASLGGASGGAPSLQDAYFYPFDPDLLIHAADQEASFSAGALRLETEASEFVPQPLATVAGLLTIIEETPEGPITSAVTLEAVPGIVGAAAAGPAGLATGAVNSDITLWAALLGAIAGGLILNLMPCVFPILAMKALSLAGKSGQERGETRRQALAYVGGVLATFTLVAAALLALRSTGQLVGWGFQLQSPAIVGGLALLMFVIGLGLSGVVEIGGRWTGIGDRLTQRGGLAGSFFTGALAVVVATPCTAPFMGAAIGFAIVRPPLEALPIFAAIGLGMSLPYLLLALYPRLATALPKPGPWMVRFKEFLAFPMYATAIWLVWVLSLLGGADAVLAVLAAMLLVALALWLWRQRDGVSAGIRRILAAVSAAGIAGALAMTGSLALQTVETKSPAAATAEDAESLLDWAAWSPATLDRLRAENRPVFVNFTAAWCITCLVNERVAFGSDSMASFLEERDVAMLKADWTHRDPEISDALAALGRQSIPVYAYYAPGAEAPVLLPQVLTESAVREAIENAAQLARR